MHIGIDFDNTIVCYDSLFHRVCRERNLIPADLPVSKSEVRNYLRRIGREDDWTEIQGYVYGARMSEADPFPGVHEFFRACRRAGVSMSIISHKTRQPYRGKAYDLHGAARDWLELQGFFDPDRIGLDREDVHFELTKEAKLERIASCGCSHFVDDLPEFLYETGFPRGVERLLFDPNDHYRADAGLMRFKSWPELLAMLNTGGLRAPATAEFPCELEGFARRQGMTEDFTWERLPGGANNRVYRLRDAERDRVLKWYFQNPQDPRDRFGNERGFYELLWEHGIRRTPEPIGWDPAHRLGLFTFVSDRKLKPFEIDADRVKEALDFVCELNTLRGDSQARGLGPGSEACFTFTEHLVCVDRRITRLSGLGPRDDLDLKAVQFVNEGILPLWREMRTRLVEKAERAGMNVGTALTEPQRCLSPSDFGFHNALLADNGQLRFFDFEYAGWDDPAKLICDFFCQPEIPVPGTLHGMVVKHLAEALRLEAPAEMRAWLLWPSYRIKWCCIMLNEFIRTDQKRRQFAGGEPAQPGRRSQQLHRAREVFEQTAEMWHCHFSPNTPSW